MSTAFRTAGACLGFLLFASALLAAQEFAGLPDYVRPHLTAIAKYPKAACIFLWCRERYVLEENGTQRYEWHSFRYIPDEAARDTWGDPHLAYVEGRQQLEILAARTYTRDGRQIESTPHNAYNPIVPEGLDKAPDYSEVRQMVVTLLGLENGCISELHYRITTPRPLFPWLEGRTYFREEWPTMSRELHVTVPAGVTLKYRSLRGAPEPVITGNTYTWRVGEQAGYLAEDLQGQRILLPNVAFSTASWTQVRDELGARIEKAAHGELALPASLADALKRASSLETRLDTIRVWLKERFNRLKFEHPEFALTLRPAARVLNTGYGNALELAVLAAKLAQQQGAEARVVPVFRPEPVVPGLREWADPVLEIRCPLMPAYFCDPREPRTEVSSASLCGAWLLPLDKEESVPEPYKGAAKSPWLNLSVVLENLDKDTLRGHGTLAAAGDWGVYEALRAGVTEQLTALVRVKGLKITQAAVKELEAPSRTGRVVVDFEFSAAALDTVEGRRVLPLDILDFKPFVKKAPLGLLKREFAQAIPLSGEIRLQVRACLPEGWTAERMPRTSKETWDWSEGEVKCEVVGGQFVFDRRLKLAREWLAAAAWPGFRSWMLESGSRPANAVVLRKL